MDQPSCSTGPVESCEVSYTVESVTRQELTDAVHCFVDILRQREIIGNEVSAHISPRSKMVAEQLVSMFLDMDAEYRFVETDELTSLIVDDKVQTIEEEDSLSSPSSRSSVPTDSSSPPQKRGKQQAATFDEKVRIVSLARLHPSWSVKSLQSKGGFHLKRKDQLAQWKKQVEAGGTIFDKYNHVDQWTYDRFVEAREIGAQVSTRMIKEWALSAAAQYTDLNFVASDTWAVDFKKRHRIRQRQVTKYVSRKQVLTLDEIQASAERFRCQLKKLLPLHSPDFVINTDQTGCEYRAVSRRTLSHQGEKATQVAVESMFKMTHSYTAQYAITLSGKLLPAVFLCMQEPSGHFGPRVKEGIKQLMADYQNVYVTCTKSGKLTSDTYTEFLDDILQPYVQDNNFCLILDSWTGQTNASLYDQRFLDEDNECICTLKVIPPHCTPLCQPCDVYFYRQVKIFIKRLQNSSFLMRQNREIDTREDSVRIHSLIHSQLSAPIFNDMISYAWYASKISEERNLFLNVNQVCFSAEVLRGTCDCKEQSFICCAWCRKTLCFTCFYDNYHPKNCSKCTLRK